MLQCVCETNYVAVSFSSFVGVLIFFLMNQLFVSIHKNTKTDLYDSISEESESDQESETSKNENIILTEELTNTQVEEVYHSMNDVPAIKNDRRQVWYFMGKIHRENDLPAVIYTSGPKKWCKMGIVHRDNDLPAIMNGEHKYYNDFLDHDLPAVTLPYTNIWFVNGSRHRDNDLPTIIANDNKTWHDSGKTDKESENNENLLSTGTHYLQAEETGDDNKLIPI